MIIKKYRNGKVVEERLNDGTVFSEPKVFKTKNGEKKRVKSNPRGRPARNPVRIKTKKKGCGCGKKK